MKVQIHEEFAATLPADDTHPYRTGAWRPQRIEYDAWDLDVVAGAIPDDLNGTYLRNTENPLLTPIERYHPFDGDGMLHSISFEAGTARYANRFVRTDGFLAERDAGESLWAGVAELPASARRQDGWGPRPAMKDASSTDVIVHNGSALTSFWLCGDLYKFDPVTLEDRGKATFGGAFPADGVSAHPKVDHRTGEMLFFNYTAESPYMHYGEVGPDGLLKTLVDVPLPGPRLPHDMAFTEHYAIVNDCPMFWDPDGIEVGLYIPRFFPDLPTRFGVIPRGGRTDQVRWFEADPTFVLHWINAYEEGDEIVLDGFFQHNPEPAALPAAGFEANLFRYLDLFSLDARPHRWRFNLATGQCREEPLSDRVLEFGMIDPRLSGRPYRFSYDALPEKGRFEFRGIVKHDVVTGQQETVELPAGVFASETVMAPRDGSTAEDDGYLVTFTMDLEADTSECLVLDAANPAGDPVARVRLPERISSGTHAHWAPATPW